MTQNVSLVPYVGSTVSAMPELTKDVITLGHIIATTSCIEIDLYNQKLVMNFMSTYCRCRA